MGTRGITGFRIDGTDKLTYQQYDSYPSGVGQQVLDFLRQAITTAPSLAHEREQARALRMVASDATPTAEDIAQLAPYTDLRVSEQSTADFYCLTRKTQGLPGEILAAGIAIDSAEFVKDSLFCEWGYVINLDTNELEVYRGFQKRKPKGRYTMSKPRGWTPEYAGETFYYPIGLIATFPFSDLPENLEAALPERD